MYYLAANRAKLFYLLVLTIECLLAPTTNTVERFVSQFLLSFPDLQHTVEEMIAEDDHVAVRFNARGTHKGQWMHFAPTGISIHYTGLTLARIVGDRSPSTRPGGTRRA